MKIPKELHCRKCPKVFCCVDCRVLHEQKTHNFSDAIEEILEDIDCPICQNEPLILKSEFHTDILDHILKAHMPLRCNKCSKMYTTIEDLLSFSKCFQNDDSCVSENIDELSKASMEPQTSAITISTQTSPFKSDTDFNQISAINMKWKIKSTSVRDSIGGSNEFISDSVSSLKNISSISNSSLRRSIDINTTMPYNKGKLVRTTSTPLPSDVFLTNQKVQTQYHYQSTEQLSSISNSANESINQSTNQIYTPSCSKIQRYQKARPRTLKPPVTPLRHVMSKSIQKAIAEHGNIYSPSKPRHFNRSGSLGSSSPVDLRMSPVIRRTQSEIIESSQLDSISEYSSQDSLATHKSLNIKKQSESIRVVRMRRTSISQCSNPSVYKTCESVEIITETSETSENLNLHSTAITPRIPKSSSVKMINFFENSDSQSVSSPANESNINDDVFYTPKSSPKNKKVSRFAGRIDSKKDENGVLSDLKNFEEKPKKGKPLWSLVSSVLGYKSGNSNTPKDEENVDLGNSLLKRCASFAGSLIKPKNDENDLPTIKRKRCHTESDCSVIKSPVQSNSSKRFRIQARKPIERMRHNSLCID